MFINNPCTSGPQEHHPADGVLRGDRGLLPRLREGSGRPAPRPHPEEVISLPRALSLSIYITLDPC